MTIDSTGVRDTATQRFDRSDALALALVLLTSLSAFLMTCPTAVSLPILGDGCLHVLVMEEITSEGSADIDTVVKYPLFYHLFGALVSMAFGGSAVKLISPVMVALSTILVYLIAVELTKSKVVGIAAMVLVASSAELIYYHVQVLMEPFLIFFVLAAIYSALLYRKNPGVATGILVSISVGTAISSKQQAVFLVVALPVFFFLTSRMSLRRASWCLALVIVIAAGPYLHMCDSAGGLRLTPSVGSLSELAALPHDHSESFLDRLGRTTKSDDVPEWSEELDEEANGQELRRTGTQDAESRHLYIWDMINPVRFVELNSLQPKESLLYGSEGYLYALMRFQGFVILQILLVSGFLLALGYAVKHSEWRIVPAIVLFSWLMMFWGSDTERYFIYLAVFLAFLVPWPLQLAHENFELSRHRIVSFLLIAATCVCLFYAIQSGVGELEEVRDLDETQCYHSSKGGIASIEEVGDWIANSTEEGERVYGTSTYEWTYYTEREVWHDYRIYFLEADRIDHYLSEVWDVKYVLIRDNQRIKDWEWNHLEYFPNNFCDRIEELYPLAYTSSCEDIRVYAVT
jgi:hypothetical protein